MNITRCFSFLGDSLHAHRVHMAMRQCHEIVDSRFVVLSVIVKWLSRVYTTPWSQDSPVYSSLAGCLSIRDSPVYSSLAGCFSTLDSPVYSPQGSHYGYREVVDEIQGNAKTGTIVHKIGCGLMWLHNGWKNPNLRDLTRLPDGEYTRESYTLWIIHWMFEKNWKQF